MSFEVDRDKLLTYLGYLVKSYSKFEEREKSKAKLSSQLLGLKKLKVGANIRRRLKSIERGVKDVVEKERMIITRQKREKGIQADIENRIRILEKKLTGFIECKKEKERRYKELEVRIEKRGSIILALKKGIWDTEKLYKKMKRGKRYPRNVLEGMTKRFDALKKRLKEIE